MIEDNSILHRLEGETDKAYFGWEQYRDLGPNRNFKLLSDKLGLKSQQHLYEWRDKFKWFERVKELEKIETLSKIEARKKTLEMRERAHLLELQSYQKLISLVKLALHNRLSFVDEDGNLKYDLQELELMSVADLMQMTQDSSKHMINLINTERTIYGLAGEVVENRFGQNDEAKELIGNIVANDDDVRKSFNNMLQLIENKQNLDHIRD